MLKFVIQRLTGPLNVAKNFVFYFAYNLFFIIMYIFKNTTATAGKAWATNGWAFYIIQLPKFLLLLNKLIAKLCQIERHGGMKHDDLTWNDIMNKHSHAHTDTPTSEANRVTPHEIVPPWIPHPLILTSHSHILYALLLYIPIAYHHVPKCTERVEIPFWPFSAYGQAQWYKL